VEARAVRTQRPARHLGEAGARGARCSGDTGAARSHGCLPPPTAAILPHATHLSVTRDDVS
jgi:hypothetical protein